MPYIIPTFNLVCNVFDNGGGAVPPVGAPRLSPACALVYGRRVNVASTGGTTLVGVPLVTMCLLLPALTDVRGPLQAGGPDIVECPAASSRYYVVAFVDDIGKGYANEHRTATLEQLAPQPVPLP